MSDWNFSQGGDDSVAKTNAAANIRGDKAKSDRTRRAWTSREEDVLRLALHDLVANNWKADNGFKPGYQTRIEEAMKRAFPQTELRVHPHILSKISTWKRCYHSLSLILDRSGVGFNLNGDHKIDCNDEQWANIVKADSNAKYMRNKSWPLWEDWKVFFGKDRAAGGQSEDVSKADDVFYPRSETLTQAPPLSYNVSLDDFFTQEQINESLNQDNISESSNKSVKSPSSAKAKTRKRKPEEVIEAMLEVMTKMHEDTNNRLQTMSTRIGYDFDLSEKRSHVTSLLATIPFLSKKHKFVACDILVKEPERLDLFRGMSDEDKHDYVMHIWEEKNGM